MTREQLEHLIRAAGVIADVEDLAVIGSQAILGQFPIKRMYSPSCIQTGPI